MYIYAGLRRAEALWLQIEDVDFTAARYGMLRIRAKTVNGREWQPKTARNRAVPISSSLRRYLDAYTPRPSDGGWYFPSPQGHHWDDDNFAKDLKAANRSAGLRWTPLDYRHTFGSQLAQKGESLYKISTLMGNSPEICRQHYAALVPEALGDAVEFQTPALRDISREQATQLRTLTTVVVQVYWRNRTGALRVFIFRRGEEPTCRQIGRSGSRRR